MMKTHLLSTMLIVGLLFLTGCTEGIETSTNVKRTCKDVTSYDYNRDNDMKCTSSNGDIKYTSYEGARLLKSL